MHPIWSSSEPSGQLFNCSTKTSAALPRFDAIRVGEPAELVVVSKSATFSQFKALQEAYLPESAAWLARYPFLARDVFLEISLDIERERQAAGLQTE